MITGKPLQEMLLCLLVAAVLFIIFFIADYFDGTHWGDDLFVWAPQTTAVKGALAGIYIFYIAIPYIVYHNAKRHSRYAVRWATAFIVFTPVLAGLAYLLT